ncbi:replication protein A 32 kDa subunit-like isoform X1 [Argonauta hians]
MWNTQGGYDSYNPNTTQGGGGYMSPAVDNKKSRFDSSGQITPVTIAEILNATQESDEFLSGDLKISQVTFVGLVHSVRETAIRVDYDIGDCTGPSLEVKHFVDNQKDTPDNEKVNAIHEKTYVRVSGHIRTFEGKRSVVAFKIAPLTDLNELTGHILEVIHSHMVLTSKEQNEEKSGLSNDYDTSVGIPGLGKLHNQVYQVIKSCTDEEGCSIDNVSKQLRGVPERSIKDVIEFLSGEGHIYSTVTENHFRITDG